MPKATTCTRCHGPIDEFGTCACSPGGEGDIGSLRAEDRDLLETCVRSIDAEFPEWPESKRKMLALTAWVTKLVLARELVGMQVSLNRGDHTTTLAYGQMDVGAVAIIAKETLGHIETVVASYGDQARSSDAQRTCDKIRRLFDDLIRLMDQLRQDYGRTVVNQDGTARSTEVQN